METHDGLITIETEKIGFSQYSYIVITDKETKKILYKMEYMRFRDQVRKAIEKSLE